MPENDQRLFSLIANGDKDAFTKIYLRYGKIIAPRIRKIVKDEAIAADIAQDVFLKIWHIRQKLTEVKDPCGWIKSMASNASTNYVRRELQYDTIKEELALYPHAGMERTEFIRGQEKDEFWEQLHQAIALLPQGQQKIIALYLERRSHLQIAESLNISIHTVKNQLTPAYKSLRKHLEKQGDNYLPIVLLLPFFQNI